MHTQPAVSGPNCGTSSAEPWPKPTPMPCRCRTSAIPAGYVTVTYYGTERETATPPVVETVERLQERGYAAGDIAILVRRNSEATRIASMLLEHKRTHPESPYRYDVITQDALVIGRSPVVNFVISCLRLAGNPEDSIHRAIYNRFLGRGFGERLTRDDTEFLLRLRLMPPEEAFENTVMRYGSAAVTKISPTCRPSTNR